MAVEEGRVTGLLLAWGRGDERALDELTPLVYGELHRLARRCFARERAGHTLQPTALVHEAFVRLVDMKRLRWKNRAQFYAISAQMMRRILVDLARTRLARKRGGGARRVTLDDALLVSDGDGSDLIAVDAALEALARVDARKARVVELRFFGGLSVDATAEVLTVSPDTVMRDWKMAKVWLLRELRA
jgi:RNA polymerase sigma factor (TIGR02999 family)